MTGSELCLLRCEGANCQYFNLPHLFHIHNQHGESKICKTLLEPLDSPVACRRRTCFCSPTINRPINSQTKVRTPHNCQRERGRIKNLEESQRMNWKMCLQNPGRKEEWGCRMSRRHLITHNNKKSPFRFLYRVEFNCGTGTTTQTLWSIALACTQASKQKCISIKKIFRLDENVTEKAKRCIFTLYICTLELICKRNSN